MIVINEQRSSLFRRIFADSAFVVLRYDRSIIKMSLYSIFVSKSTSLSQLVRARFTNTIVAVASGSIFVVHSNWLNFEASPTALFHYNPLMIFTIVPAIRKHDPARNSKFASISLLQSLCNFPPHFAKHVPINPIRRPRLHAVTCCHVVIADVQGRLCSGHFLLKLVGVRVYRSRKNRVPDRTFRKLATVFV